MSKACFLDQYTNISVAPRFSNCLDVSFPIPVLSPEIKTTFPFISYLKVGLGPWMYTVRICLMDNVDTNRLNSINTIRTNAFSVYFDIRIEVILPNVANFMNAEVPFRMYY